MEPGYHTTYTTLMWNHPVAPRTTFRSALGATVFKTLFLKNYLNSKDIFSMSDSVSVTDDYVHILVKTKKKFNILIYMNFIYIVILSYLMNENN